MTLESICGEGINGKAINVNCLIMGTPLPYNNIIGWSAINILGEVIFTIYLVLKGKSIQSKETNKSLKNVTRVAWWQREELVVVGAQVFEVPNDDLECWDPRLGAEVERLTP